jgi:ATP-dependent exoDNAse (exonuclease V) alpha subunit
LLTSGHSLDLVVGVAGSGKTSILSAVREGFEAAGYKVLGAATSGQAAKALGEGAGVASRTVASLTWRIEHGQEVLSPRHVLVLDEGSMTSDSDVGRLLAAVGSSGAKLVAVGDYRQLGSVGPGGALEPSSPATLATSGRLRTTCGSVTQPSAMLSTISARATSLAPLTGTASMGGCTRPPPRKWPYTKWSERGRTTLSRDGTLSWSPTTVTASKFLAELPAKSGKSSGNCQVLS